jgi:hypothetical protein
MKLAFNPFTRNLTGFVSCVAFAFAASAGIDARGAVTYNADSNQALARSLSSGIMVDWNLDFHMMPVSGSEDDDRPELACLSTDELDGLSIVQRVDSADIADTNAADDGDYMEYKYGHYGRYFGGANYQNPTPAQSAKDGYQDDFSTQADDPSNVDNTAAIDGQGPIEDDLDPGMSPSSEKYSYMAVEEQVGRNEGSTAKGDDDENMTNPKEGAADKDNDDDSATADDDCSEDSVDDDSPESGAFTEAVVDIATQMADDWSGRYGMKFTDVERLFGANK